MQRMLTWRKTPSSLGRKRSASRSAASTSASDAPKGDSAQYRSSSYETLLETAGSYMNKPKQAERITRESKALCNALLKPRRSPRDDTLFHDDAFERTCANIQGKNEAKIIQDISRLIVPSGEALASVATHLEILTESVNEKWSNSKPLSKPAPQPDYSLGFRRESFTEEQHAKLLPFIGDFVHGDHSDFMATHYMYFPFLACEVKCGAQGLDIADRQNMHSMTLAVRGVVLLFRLLKRQDELDGQILAFSISHDHRSVRIYGHYPVIDGTRTKYYRHQVHTFDFTALDGRDKWTAYGFTRNVYDTWVPGHFKKICSAIDQLPPDWDDIPSEMEPHRDPGAMTPRSQTLTPCPCLWTKKAG